MWLSQVIFTVRSSRQNGIPWFFLDCISHFFHLNHAWHFRMSVTPLSLPPSLFLPLGGESKTTFEGSELPAGSVGPGDIAVVSAVCSHVWVAGPSQFQQQV